MKETSAVQAKLNDKYAAQKLAWEILCNFIPHKDLFVTLTHEGYITEEEARRKRKVFLAKMRKYWKDRGQEFKYIVVTEKQGQWHHHLIMQDTPWEVIKSFWGEGEGRVMISTLDPSDSYKGLSEYLIGPEKPGKSKKGGSPKAPRRKGQRRYSCSRNLKKPEIEVKELKRITKTEPRPPKGYIVKEWSIWADEGGALHKEYRCIWAEPGDPPLKKRRRQRKE